MSKAPHISTLQYVRPMSHRGLCRICWWMSHVSRNLNSVLTFRFPNVGMSNVPHVMVSCPTYKFVMSLFECVMSRIRMSLVPPTYECVVSHTWMYLACMHTHSLSLSHTHTLSCSRYVTSHTCVMSHTWICECVMSHTYKSRVVVLLEHQMGDRVRRHTTRAIRYVDTYVW